MLSREEAITILKKYIHEEYLLKKSLSVEAILKKLAKRLNKNTDLWSLTGLLHNIDYEYTLDNPQERGIISVKLLSGLIPEECVNAIKGNNYIHTNYAPVTSLDKSLIASIEITDLMFEIIKNSKKNNSRVIDISEIYDKYKNTNFAPRVERNRIKVIEDAGIEIEEFFKITLKSIIEIKDDLNL